MKEMKGKTVFILGAGFSIEAGAPSQSELVEKIFDTAKKHGVFKKVSIEKFKTFLTNTLCIPEDKHKKVPLEDIFTPLDRCIADNISFRNLDVKQVVEMREVVCYLISRTMEYVLKEASGDKDYIKKFAKYVVKNQISVISTNWDIMLDNSLKEVPSTIDYGCQISRLDRPDESGYHSNVKLLKLHGSLNWLQCPRCQRSYYADEKIANSPDKKCPLCESCFGKRKSHKLTSNMIMPTFMKDLSNPQYKQIWYNAGIELSEASKIVFIGYSLPQADFELRQLLSRMVSEKATIEVVDFGEEEDEDERFKTMKQRYEIFFGSRTIDFYREGAKNYIENKLIKKHSRV